MRNSFVLAILLTLWLSSSAYSQTESSPEPSSKTLSSSQMTYQLIPLDTLSYDFIDPLIRPMLSPGGIMTFEPKRQSILIGDTPAKIKEIKNLLKQLEVDPVNIRIDIDYSGAGTQRDRGVKVGFDYGSGPGAPAVIIRDGKVQKPTQIVAKVKHQTEKTSRLNSSFITTLSGRPASLWSGTTMIDPTWRNYAVLRPIIVGPGSTVIIEGPPADIKWANVGISLDVLPTLLGNGLIEVEIYPRLSYLTGKGKKEAVKVETLSTKVQIKPGARLAIGGLIENKRNDFNQLFGPDFLKMRSNESFLDIILTAQLIRPDGSSANPPPAPQRQVK